jgi:sulfite dehydrogenase
MKLNCLVSVWIVAYLVAQVGTSADVLKIELPPESVTLKPGPAAELVAANCLTCHSADYLSTQPRLPRTYWKSAVEKMQQKFGAPIAAEQVEPLVDYLAKTYGIDKSVLIQPGR